MSTALVIYLLTALAALVVVLTRVRLGGRTEGAGRFAVSRGLLNLHTGSGVVALALWVPFLAAGENSFFGDALIGIIALFFWWLVALCGLLILLRWLPSRGKHAIRLIEDSWGDGPALSLLAHGGMLIGVCVFTVGYLTAAV